MISALVSDNLKPAPGISMLRSVELAGPAGRLEALLNEGAADAHYAALVCHPHPLGGGTMHNKIVYHAMKALNAPEWGLCWPVLRFNFRGTGLSQGVHDGQAETGDVLAALNWLEGQYNRPIVLVGFSFGAAMALRACCNTPSGACSSVRALAALGLPTHVEAGDPDSEPLSLGPQSHDYIYPFLADCTLPKLFLSGDRDQFAPAGQLQQIVAAASEPKRLVLLPGADHFFAGQLQAMQSTLAGWLKEQVL
jgi:alpha/beta superfamily hydrolase